MGVRVGYQVKHKEMQYLRHTYPAMLFVVYLIFKFNWVSFIFICWIWRPQLTVYLHSFPVIKTRLPKRPSPRLGTQAELL